MYRNERTRNIILIVLAVCLIGITVAYATLSQNLNISGVANVDKTSWNIHFTNVLTPKVEGQATGGKAVLNSESTVITISEGTLSAPGDKIIYTFDVINEGGGNTTTGETLPSNYSYTGYAARFLTFQEVKKGTGINIPTWKTGELDNFTYLLENIKFASDKNNALTWWLENARSDTSASAWDVNGDGRNVQTTTVFRMPATLEFVQQ